MSFSDRIVAALKTMLLIQEQVTRLETSQRALQSVVSAKMEDHDRRLTRLETIIEIAKPDGAVLRLAPRASHRAADDEGRG